MNEEQQHQGGRDSLSQRLHRATGAADLLAAEHIHIGRVDQVGGLKALWGIARGTNRKLDGFDLVESGQTSTVALAVDNRRFMLTITKSFVLLTIQEGTARIPIIHKMWKLVKSDINPGHLRGIYFDCETYTDSDGLKWEHRFGWSGNSDELVAFDAKGEESIRLTLETLS